MMGVWKPMGVWNFPPNQEFNFTSRMMGVWNSSHLNDGCLETHGCLETIWKPPG